MKYGNAASARVAKQRISRAAFGAALLVSSFFFFVYSCAAGMVSRQDFARLGFIKDAEVWVLLGAWAFALGAWALSRIVSHRKFRGSSIGRQVAPFSLADDKARFAAKRFSVLSLAMPLAALSLIMPLSIHFIVDAIGFGPSRFFPMARGMSQWVMISLAVVGHAHIALALFGVYHAKRKVAGRPIPDAGMWAWGLAVLVSAIPGALLLAIPPILVGLSGFFIPLMYSFMNKVWEREENALA